VLISKVHQPNVLHDMVEHVQYISRTRHALDFISFCLFLFMARRENVSTSDLSLLKEGRSEEEEGQRIGSNAPAYYSPGLHYCFSFFNCA
jgi:hypothetical protein